MKKYVIYLLIAIVIALFSVVPVEAKQMNTNNSVSDVVSLAGLGDPNDEFDHNCADFAKTIRMGGYLIFLVKIMLPFVVMFYAVKKLFSVVMNGKSDELKKQAVSFAYSCGAAIMIFFIPRLVSTIFGFVDTYNREKTSDMEVCVACVFEPLSEECSKYAD